MATSTASIQRKRRLPGIELIGRLFEACKLQAIALQEGGLGGDFGSCRHADSSFCCAEVNVALHARFLPPPGHLVACYLHRAPPGSWCAGMPLQDDTLLIALPDSACELALGARAHFSMMLAPLHSGVRRAIEALPGSFGVAGRQFAVLSPHAHAGTPWRVLYDMLSHSLIDANDSELARLMQDIAADLLMDEDSLCVLLADAAAMPRHACAQDLHYPALRKAVQWMRESLGRDLYMEEVAAAAQVSDRTLRLAFDDLLGVSPTHYLGLLRLHEAARRLSGSQGRRLSVKTVAMDCGMWNLSRFAASYYRVFGERPSDTRLRGCSVVS